MSDELALGYRSSSQRARVITESWGEQNLYCPNCPSPSLKRLANNTEARDFACPRCGFEYQLKGQLGPLLRVIDGAFDAMMRAIRQDRTPNFYFLRYERVNWRIEDLMIVPSFAFPPSAIIKRKPLGPTARRAGWVGCNIQMTRIPLDARIAVVRDGNETPAAQVREKFRRVKPLKDISVKERGWTLDVLNLVRRVSEGRGRGNESGSGRPGAGQRLLTSSPTEFTNEDIYAHARELEQLHPDNRHVKDKIRQQLQVLRDAGLLIHVSAGVWRLP